MVINNISINKESWFPFRVECSAFIAPRPLQTIDGVCDRLRVAAFSEVQAERGFLRAAEIYSDAPFELRDLWIELAEEESRHRGWLLDRLNELGQTPDGLPVHDGLWRSLLKCTDAKSFSHYMADAERRGQRAGERFYDQLKIFDPKTSAIFGQIAKEETRHIEIASRFYGVKFN